MIFYFNQGSCMHRATLAASIFLMLGSVGGTAAPSNAPSGSVQCDSPEARQFDFWVGTWDSYDEKGKLQGRLLVEKILGDCALQEWWRGSDGGTGTSLTMWDASRKVWNQTWVSSHGTLLPLEGYKIDSSIVLIGMHMSRSGQAQLHRTTWTPGPEGSVHQLWDYSVDGGKTWVVNYDGYLRPSKQAFQKENI
jgi:hypothetical protein